ncbi:MAG: LLM class flavin-dependent oxidoreductase [Microbacteriaceae bacterium]|nr:LLM class flavin-dependent oxidoreductase [Microbacteriaceae bacterium]MCL2793969.1 LLM class flavin-dependent oxidoreductase [Microbacteriaceae bacterium]
MARLQHFGWFFSRGFGPQAWGREDYRWGYEWHRPELYVQAVQQLEQAGLDLVILEDALSIGSPSTIDLRTRQAYGGPKHDPLLLVPYLLNATRHLGFTPTINPVATPPYLAARQAATLHHLSGGRYGMNVVTDVASSRHFGVPPLDHDHAYDRAAEWLSVVRKLWHSWGEGAYVNDPETHRFADGSKIDAFRHQGEYYDVTGPLNAIPFDDGDPVIVSPGGSPRGIAFAGSNSEVQLALAPLDVSSVAGYRERVIAAAADAGRAASSIKTLFVFKPEIVSSRDEVDRVVAASEDPTDAELHAILLGQSSDLETDLTVLDWDQHIDPDAVFGQHVSRGSIKGLLAGAASFEEFTLRELLRRHARKGRAADRAGWVGTAEDIADYIEEFGEVAGNDGFIFSGDLHPTTVHRFLDRLVPELRRRGLLRTEYGDGNLRANLTEF